LLHFLARKPMLTCFCVLLSGFPPTLAGVATAAAAAAAAAVAASPPPLSFCG
jgi:hypothetical protein